MAADEDLVCSDLCEEHGFARQAETLRALAGARTAYVVMERGAEYNDEIMQPDADGGPAAIYLGREEAERVAAVRNAQWHREHNIFDYCYSLNEITELSEAELEKRIGEILGRPFTLPNGGEPTWAYSEEPLVGGPVTDDQMRRIAELFTLKFFYVAETHFAAPAPSLLEDDR